MDKQSYKVVFSTELVVTLIYTWEECAGNQRNLHLNLHLQVGSSETTREAPYIYFKYMGEDIVRPGRKLLQ